MYQHSEILATNFEADLTHLTYLRFIRIQRSNVQCMFGLCSTVSPFCHGSEKWPFGDSTPSSSRALFSTSYGRKASCWWLITVAAATFGAFRAWATSPNKKRDGNWNAENHLWNQKEKLWKLSFFRLHVQFSWCIETPRYYYYCYQGWGTQKMDLLTSPQTVVDYGKLINFCRKKRQWKRALRLLTEVQARQLELNLILASSAISSCEASCEWRQSLSLLHQLGCNKIDANVISFNASISSCEKSAQWQKALVLASSIQQMGTVVTHSALTSSFEKASKWRMALQFLNSCPSKSLEVSLVTYNAATSACEKSGQGRRKSAAWQEALLLMKDVEWKGWQKDAVLYGAVISACQKAGKLREAIALLKEAQMLQLGSVNIYSATISACESSADSRWDLALDLLGEMKFQKFFANVVSYSAAASACAKAGKWSQALALLREAVKTVTPNVILYSAVIFACEKAAKWQHALELWHELEVADLQPDVVIYTSLLGVCARAAASTQALALWETFQLTTWEPNLVTYCSAITACEKRGQARQALEFMQEMEPRLYDFAAAMNEKQWF